MSLPSTSQPPVPPLEWQETLAELAPVRLEWGIPDLIFDPASLLDQLFASLSPLERELLWRRYAIGQTCEVLTFHFGTLERVRTLEKNALKRIFLSSPQLQIHYERLFRNAPLYLWLRFEPSRTMPEAIPADLLSFTLELLEQVFGVRVREERKGYKHERVPLEQLECQFWGRRAMLYSRDLLELVRDGLEQSGRFTTLKDSALALQIPETWLKKLVHAAPELNFDTQSRILFQARTQIPLLETLARVLATAGVLEWRLSEMLCALQTLQPELFEATTAESLGVSMAQSRRRVMIETQQHRVFQKGGRRGMWQLSETGDGFESNKAAILALLERSDIPLHLSVIHHRLERNLLEDTVLAVLTREAEFQAFRGKVFGRLGHDYSIPCPEEIWLLERLALTGQVKATEIEAQALRAGVDMGRVRSVGGFSSKVRYVWAIHNSSYQSFSFYAVRLFKRWLKDPSRTLPGTEVLLEGVRSAFGRNQLAAILKVQRALEASGREIPLDFMDYFYVAEAHVQL